MPDEVLQAKPRNPTGKRIRRDGWLSPLTLSKTTLSAEPEVHTQGVRSSDRGFLHIRWSDYKRLLDWTAAQSVAGQVAELPNRLAHTLSEVGIDASMWRGTIKGDGGKLTIPLHQRTAVAFLLTDRSMLLVSNVPALLSGTKVSAAMQSRDRRMVPPTKP